MLFHCSDEILSIAKFLEAEESTKDYTCTVLLVAFNIFSLAKAEFLHNCIHPILAEDLDKLHDECLSAWSCEIQPLTKFEETRILATNEARNYSLLQRFESVSFREPIGKLYLLMLIEGDLIELGCFTSRWLDITVVIGNCVRLPYLASILFP